MKHIAVVFGGRSTEHDVSIVTALGSVMKSLKLLHDIEVVPIYISKEGKWYSAPEFADIKQYQSGAIEALLQKTQPIQLEISSGFTIVWPKNGLKPARQKKIDVVFPAMHGTYGEDGSLMGLLEMANVPYVGCDQAASVIAMNKVLAKQVTNAAKVPSTPWISTSRNEVQSDINGINARCKDLEYPLFVKPAHLGSSIGITRALEPLELRNGLELAAYYDDTIIVEQGVQDLIEVTLPVIGNEVPRPGLLERPLLKSEDFFDFDTKYMQGGKKGGGKNGKTGAQGYSELPTKLPEHLYNKAVTVGLETYKAIGCSGIARVDMLINSKTEEVFFNEVNPMPGDLYAHNWRAAGLSGLELVEQLINYAEEKWQSRQTQTTTFSTNYLKQF